MPRIIPVQRTVSAQTDVPGRRAAAADFGGGGGLYAAGQTLSNFGAQLQETQQRQEVSDVSARLAQTRADLTIELDQTLRNAVPGDLTVAEKFMAQARDKISALGDNISTKGGAQAFDRGSAVLTADIQRSVVLAQADLAGKKAKQDFLTTLAANRNTLLSDPTQYQSLRAELLASLKDPQGPYALMPTAAREQLAVQARRDLGLSMAQGLIRLNPEFAKKQLLDGTFDEDLAPEDKVRLIREAELGIASQATESARARKAADRAAKEAQAATSDALFTDFAKGDLTMQQVLDSNLPAFGANSKNAFRLMIDAANKAETPAAISRRTTIAAFAAINAPDDDPSKIRDVQQIEDMFKRGALTLRDFNALRKEFQESRSPEGEKLSVLKSQVLDIATRGIDPSRPVLGFVSVIGGQRLYEYQRYMADRIQEFRKDPKKDVFELFDPTSPNYLGRPSLILRYRPSLQEQVREVTTFLNSPSGRKASDQKQKSLKSIFGIK